MKNADPIAEERIRIISEYDRREVEIEQDRYAPWQPGEILMTSERKRIAAVMLKDLNRFPKVGDRCLEIGYGKLGWLTDVISWGLKETDLYGIELDARRARQAQEALPNAHLEVGDAAKLPWNNNYFEFVVVSTVFSSILDLNMRALIADEITRVLSRKGTVLFYDAAVNNPRNKNLIGVKRADLKALFPDFACNFRSATLAPPIARFAAKRSWMLAGFLSGIPMLRTHFVAILVRR